jgi:ADP-heptose:LPS heptosyltransferase
MKQVNERLGHGNSGQLSRPGEDFETEAPDEIVDEDREGKIDDDQSTDAIVARADLARDEGSWAIAADLYGRAMEADPSKTYLLVGRGNCLKDAGQYSAALQCYAQGLAFTDDGDPEVQMGHLFKISGNISAAARAYRRGARVGNKWGIEELAVVRNLSEEVLCIDGTDGTSGVDTDVPLWAFWDIISCDRDGMANPSQLRRAASILAVRGAKYLARAFFELAYLVGDAGRLTKEHVNAVLHTNLWNGSHFSDLTRAENSLSADRPSDARLQLRTLSLAALSLEPGFVKNDTQSVLNASRDESWPPRELSRQDSAILLPKISTSLHRVYEEIALRGMHDGADAMSSIVDLSRVVAPFISCVAFCSARSQDDFVHCATRVLNDCVLKWLCSVQSRYMGPFAASKVVSAYLALRSNPLRERIHALSSAASAFNEIDSLISVSNASSEAKDQAVARVLSVCLPDLSINDRLALYEITSRASLPHTRSALDSSLIDWIQASPVHYGDEAVGIAQRLKHAGEPLLALNVLDRCIDEKAASFSGLVEKAIVAKVCGDFRSAARLMELCATKEPDNAFVRSELVAILPEIEPLPEVLRRFQGDKLFMEAARKRLCFRIALGEETDHFGMSLVGDEVPVSKLTPEIASELAFLSYSIEDREELRILDCGWRRYRTSNGTIPQLQTYDFVRARVTSRTRIVGLRVRLDGKTVGYAEPSESALVKEGSLRHTFFNSWLDLAFVAEGPHELQLYFEESGGGYRSTEQIVWVDSSPATLEEMVSAATVILTDNVTNASLEERINLLPSEIWAARRTVFEGQFERILVIRIDQLGDVVTSLPAMMALKNHFPKALLSCLAAPSNHDLLRSTGLFENIFGIDLTYDPRTRKRHTPFNEQVRLSHLFADLGFDLAIDLSPGTDSRPLLRLANSRYTAGFRPTEFPWLSFGIDVQARDAANLREAAPHSCGPIALVEALVLAANHKAFRLPRNSSPAALTAFGLEGGKPFAVFHGGARTASRKWPIPNYVALARQAIQEAGLTVLILLDSDDDLAGVDTSDLSDSTFKVVTQRLDFSVFDTLLSHCAVFVGNDTGPKHLAALRGVPVVSIHMGAVNWREWGHEGSGFIVTRRVPCHGCGIEEIEECGKELPCLVYIKPAEVFTAMQRALAEAR